MIIVKRIMAGLYTYTLEGFVVRVEDREPNPAYGDTKRMWMAIAEWDEEYAYSDPVESKREAVIIAKAMLERKVREDG